MGRKRILVARDDELLSALEGAFFLSGGVDILLAESGRQAFAMIEEHDPDLVFLVPDMDAMSGIDCCEMVKSDPILKITPIVAVLPAEKADFLTDCCREIFDDTLSKPIDAHKLHSLTCRYLGICERPNRRVTARLPAHFRVRGRKRHGLTMDLGLGGAFVETSHLMPVNTEFDLELELPGDGGKLKARTRVAWVNHPEWIKKDDYPCGMGVAFAEICDEARQALEGIVENEGG